MSDHSTAGQFKCEYCRSVRYTTLQEGPRSLFGKTICDGCWRTRKWERQLAEIRENGT